MLFRSDRPEIAELHKWREMLPGAKDMAVIISGGNLEERQSAALMLGEGFAEYPDLLEDPLYALPTDVFLSSGLYYLTQEKLDEIKARVNQALEGTRELDLTSPADLVTVADTLSRNTEGSRMLAQGLEAFVKATSTGREQRRYTRTRPGA